MKNYVIAMLALMLTSSMFSQSEEDYENTLKLIQKSFNENNSSLIHEKFESNLKATLEKVNLEKMIDSLHKEKGSMNSYEFIMEEENEKNYLVDFEYASMLIVLHLTPDGEISTFKITEY